ncbi:MAG: MJ0042-type zinc finger domain-containing protein [Gemmataceae bacterium]
MPIIVACPSCGGKLRVADALLGQRVRCPACNHTFDSAAEPASPPPSSPTPQDLPLQLSLDDTSSPPRPAPSVGKGGLVGAVEVKLALDDEASAPPRAPIPPPAEPSRRPPPRCSDERRRDWDVPDIRRRGPRRDAEPDRGAVVLTLGIVSLAGTIIYCAAPLWAILGLVAWIMGQADLRKMKKGQMDDNGRGMTQAGWICGILGVVFNGLLILTCGGFAGVAWYLDRSRPPNTQPIRMMRPPRKGRVPKPANPPKQNF